MSDENFEGTVPAIGGDSDFDSRPSKTWKKKTGCGWLYITITEVNGQFKDVFCNLGKSGSCTIAWTQALARIISKAISDYHMPIEEVIKQLGGIQCPNQLPFPKPGVKSCPDAISQILRSYMQFDKKLKRV